MPLLRASVTLLLAAVIAAPVVVLTVVPAPVVVLTVVPAPVVLSAPVVVAAAAVVVGRVVATPVVVVAAPVVVAPAVVGSLLRVPSRSGPSLLRHLRIALLRMRLSRVPALLGAPLLWDRRRLLVALRRTLGRALLLVWVLVATLLRLPLRPSRLRRAVRPATLVDSPTMPARITGARVTGARIA